MLMPEGVLTSFNVYIYDTHRYFVGQAFTK